MMPAKSYWQSAYTGSDSAKSNIRSWFGLMADDMTPYKDEILCDVETDREKKIRAFMTDEEGQHYQFERTLGGKKFTISRKRIEAPRTHSEAPRTSHE